MLLTRRGLGCVSGVLVWMATAISVTAYEDYNDPSLNQNQPDYNDVTDQTSPLYCFQCNSRVDPECLNIQPNDTANYFYKPCLDTEAYDGHQPFCRKIIQKIYERDNMEIVVRKCGWIKHPRLDCYSVRNDDHEETICQCFYPGCNGSSSLLPSAAVLAVLALAQLAYRSSSW